MSVRNGIILLVALSALTLLVGCGSSSPKAVPPPSGGFSNSNLNGTYVFSSAGDDASNGFLSMAGTLVADGNGGITGGTIDVVGLDTGVSSPPAQPVNSGSYTVTVDGRGQATLNTNSALGAVKLDFVLTSSSHGFVTEFDGNGSGSGTLDLQSPVTQLSQLAGSYAFSLSGIDGGDNPEATVGSFTLDASGNVTAGVQDFNDAKIPVLAVAITSPAPAVLGTGNGPGTITLGTATFDFYVIDATHLKFIETDFNAILSGDVFTQAGASIPTGPLVFTLSGLDSGFGPIATGGLMISDGAGNITGGLQDVNDAGTVPSTQVPFSGTYAPGGLIGGRNILNLSGLVPATQLAIYPSSGGLMMLETDSTALTLGTAFAQTNTALASPQGYAFNLSGFNLDFGLEEDDIAEFVASGGSVTGLFDANDQGSFSFDKNINGTYTLDGSNSGRGELTTSNFLNGVFYVVDASNVLFVETDTNQVGTGSFGLQSSTAPSALMMMHVGKVLAKGSGNPALHRHR